MFPLDNGEKLIGYDLISYLHIFGLYLNNISKLFRKAFAIACRFVLTNCSLYNIAFNNLADLIETSASKLQNVAAV